MCIAYQATNAVNGKRYIGVSKFDLRTRQTKHHSDAKRGSRKAFHRALRKYGVEAFSWEILETHETEVAVLDAEVRLVRALKPEYNMTSGGKGVGGLSHSEETKAKLRASHTPERKARFKELRTGFHHTEEAKMAMSVAKTGRPLPKKPGWKPSKESIETARRLGKENAGAFLARVGNRGPMTLARRVVCLDNSEEYESASAAARAYGVQKSAVIEMCLGARNRASVGGYHFAYKDGSTPKCVSKKHKLTAEDVAKIRLLDRGDARDIAKRFGVDRVTILDIFSGRSWKIKDS